MAPPSGRLVGRRGRRMDPRHPATPTRTTDSDPVTDVLEARGDSFPYGAQRTTLPIKQGCANSLFGRKTVSKGGWIGTLGHEPTWCERNGLGADMPVAWGLGENVARIRKARNLSQEELAAAAGVAVDTVARLERG
ncbi:MAG TPA: helix-turn-helix transcriptional regulator, partial [Pseudonocardiaceae bacterium]